MTALDEATSLGEVAREALRKFAGRPALWVAGRTYTYADLEQLANAIAAQVDSAARQTNRVAILASRNEVAYGAVLGTLLAGRAYVPLNPRFSAARIVDILQQADVDLVVADPEGASLLESIRESLPARLAVAVPDAQRASWHSGTAAPTAAAARDDVAYIMFTSGTTGRPKGVPVSHGNALAFLANMRARVPVVPSDRFLQLLDLSFDPSLHDLFGCWLAGACLYSAPEGMATMADRFVREFQITHFCAVASTASLLQAQGRLSPDSLASLRHTIFGGEALPVGLAAAWRQAAPQSTVRNHYGPTEATVAITECVWQDAWEAELSGSVPIGEVFDDQAVLLVDESLQPVQPGTSGELMVAGSQVARGYLNNPEATRRGFISLPGDDRLWYRTGDLVEADPHYGLRYRGRVDQQLKVRGFRVEGQEVESHVRAVSGSDLVAVIGWPKDQDGLVTGLVAFAVAPRLAENQVLDACRKRMPDYMVPARVVAVAELPVTATGKIDYRALTEAWESRGRRSDGI